MTPMSPAPRDEAKGSKVRSKPATPLKNATPVKSPETKKTKVSSPQRLVQIQDTQEQEPAEESPRPDDPMQVEIEQADDALLHIDSLTLKTICGVRGI